MMRVAITSAVILGAALTVTKAETVTPSSSGTGFLINDEGWALTNAHVVEGCTTIRSLGFGDAIDRKSDRQNDLAVIKFSNSEGKPTLNLRASPARLGDDIAAFGYPLRGLLSDAIKVTTGNINSLVGIDNDTRFLQVSTPLQPGNSGGPIVDRTGSVVGVATAVLGSKFAETTGILPQNVNFAIRSNVAEIFLQSHGIHYASGTSPSAPLSTADLAETVSPAVIQILCFSDGQNAVGAMPPPTAPAQNAAQDRPSLTPEQIATAFAYAYHQEWSSPNESALSFMDGVYITYLEFYGARSSATNVLKEKRNFANRWPVRDYSIRDGSLSVTCVQTICSVSALVDWFAHSPSRNRSSNGVASFNFEVDTELQWILSETGSVIKGQSASPVGMLARWQDQNGKCRGGSGDDSETWKACEARDYTELALRAAGWCYGREGEYGYQMNWHRCGPVSIRN